MGPMDRLCLDRRDGAGDPRARQRAVPILDLGNIALLYLLPVMAAANLFGLRTGLFAGLASSIAYNFFFLPPNRHL